MPNMAKDRFGRRSFNIVSQKLLIIHHDTCMNDISRARIVGICGKEATLTTPTTPRCFTSSNVKNEFGGRRGHEGHLFLKYCNYICARVRDVTYDKMLRRIKFGGY